jgi:acyl-CoA synthetase (AMP-forming)/AMP-acid ligase II
MPGVTHLLAHVLARHTTPALVLDDRVLTWADLDDLSTSFAAMLAARGLLRGDRVAVFAQNGPGVVIALLACHRAGFVYVPINPGYQDEELAHVVTDSGAKVVLRDDDLVVPAKLAHAQGELPDERETALLIYTSGTTGKSKGCMLTFGNVAAAVTSLSGLWRISDHDEIVHALPLFHVHGLCVALHGALLRGARTRLLPRFTPEAVVDGVRRGGTVFMGVPTMYRRLLDHLERHPTDGEVLAKARLFCAGSAPLPAADLEEFERKTGHRIVERYGMSETLITLSNPLEGVRKAGSVGKPIPGVSIRVVDDELLVRGPGVMRGYWNNPEATEKTFVNDDEGRWLKTGDLVKVDDDGYVTIVGRSSTDILKVGGYKISTREIEEQLMGTAGIRDVAVVGVPDREWGQRVIACVVVDEPLASLSRDALLAELQARTKLHASKKPRGVLVVDALPRNAMGKVQKTALAQLAVHAGA